MSEPSSSDVHTEGSGEGDFKCAGCGSKMTNWREGSKCDKCRDGVEKAAGQTAKPKAGGAAAGGSVQGEFPSCPSCGVNTPDGSLCDDCRTNRDRDHQMGDLTLEQTAAQREATKADMEEENERRSIRQRARAAMARMLGLDEDDIKKAYEVMSETPPTVLKSSSEKRFSYAPMYMPGRMDAHDEFVKSADDLQEAAWEYVRKTGADRTIYLQHIDKPAGEWVEITSWPYDVEAPMKMPDGRVRKAKLPAGTVYMGVIWEPWAYEMVKKGKLLGFSMGGWAKRVEAELVEKATTVATESWQEAGVVNPQHPALTKKLPFDEKAARHALGIDD